MKKLSLVLFSILMLFSVCINVNEYIVTGEGFSGTGITVNNQSVRHSLIGNPSPLIGVRISFVTSSGTRITSQDYVLRYPSGKTMAESDEAFSTSGLNKATYLTTGSKVTFTSKLKTIKSNRSLKDIFSAHNFNIDLSLTDTVANHAYKISNAKDWFNEEKYKGKDYQKDLKALLREFLPSYDLDSEESIKNLFFVIEPTTLIELRKLEYKTADGVDKVYKPLGKDLDKVYVYGTLYELANLVYGIPDSSDTGPGNGLTKTFYTPFRRNLACSGYLKGEILDQTKEAQVPNFSSGKYFGIINPLNSVNEAVCFRSESESGSRFDISYVIGNSSLGMSLVWFYDKLTPELTCEKVHEIASIPPYDSNNLLKCEDVEDGVVKLFNEKHGTEYEDINFGWYKNKCGCQAGEEVVGYNCTPNYHVGMCKNPNDQITYSDVNSENEIEYWENCVYKDGGYSSDLSLHKYSDQNKAYTFYDRYLSNNNKWCPVYCVENINTSFLTFTEDVVAGRYITWPTGSSLTGSRTCQLYSRLQEDWKDGYQSSLYGANNSSISGYNENTLGTKMLEALSGVSKTELDCQGCCLSWASSSCSTVEDKNGCSDLYSTPSKVRNVSCTDIKEDPYPCNCATCCTQTGENCDEEGNCTPIKSCGPCNCSTCYRKEGMYCTFEVCTQCQTLYHIAKPNFKWNKCQMMDKLSEYKEDTESGYISCNKIDGSVGAAYCQNAYDAAVREAKSMISNGLSTYNSSTAAAKSMKRLMQTCYTWIHDEDRVYTANPIASLDYTDTGYEVKKEYKDLVSELDEENSSHTADDTRCKSQTDYHMLCSLPDGGCSTTEVIEVKNCAIEPGEKSKALAIGVKKFDFSLDPMLYNYITKDNNLSSMTKPLFSDYIVVDYGNIPVRYDYPDGIYNISLKYSMLGHIDVNDVNSTTTDEILYSSMQYGDDYGTWSCEYNLNSKLIYEKENNKNIDNKSSGINVIYRSIDLNNPFPSMDGDGRKVGENWCYEDNCNNDNYLIEKVITDYKIPDEPMYSFVLTPTVIRQIRQYNNEEVDGKKRNYSDFNLKCEGETGKACVSDFLTELKNMFNEEVGGTCFKYSFSRVSDSNYFYSECKEDFYY